VDIRSSGADLIISHDPYVAGESFSDWIEAYAHGTLILNVKEEGLEARLIETMKTRGIDDYFFLDQSFPFLLKTAATGERRCAVRVSEFESADTALALADRIDWVWVDCFTRFPLDRDTWLRLQGAGLKLCLVSPDLLGRTDDAEFLAMRALLAEWDVTPDAVCAKLAKHAVWTNPPGASDRSPSGVVPDE
jgi:hypothetical protein